MKILMFIFGLFFISCSQNVAAFSLVSAVGPLELKKDNLK